MMQPKSTYVYVYNGIFHVESNSFFGTFNLPIFELGDNFCLFYFFIKFSAIS